MGKTVNKKSFVQKSKELMRQNIWLLWIAVIVSTGWDVVVDTAMRDKIDGATQRLDAAANKISKGIVLLDLLGRPVVSQPIQLTPVNPAFKQAILGYIKMYGVYDWSDLTNNFTVKIHSLDDIYRHNPNIELFKNEFFVKDSKALKGFEAYLTKNAFLISKNKLPESISIINEEINLFTVKDGGFVIKIDFTVQAREFNARTDKLELREGHILIDAKGDLDPSLGTPSNPLGIQFQGNYKPTILEKKAK